MYTCQLQEGIYRKKLRKVKHNKQNQLNYKDQCKRICYKIE